jgi:hypothetical protein
MENRVSPTRFALSWRGTFDAPVKSTSPSKRSVGEIAFGIDVK